MATTYFNIALVYQERDNLEEAIKMYQLCLTVEEHNYKEDSI